MIKEIAVIKLESDYTWYTYTAARGTNLTTKSGKHSVKLVTGSKWGVRSASSNKAEVRLITEELGPTIVFSLTPDLIDKLILKSQVSKTSKQQQLPSPAANKVTPKRSTPQSKRPTVKGKIQCTLDVQAFSDFILSFAPRRSKYNEEDLYTWNQKLGDFTYLLEGYFDSNAPSLDLSASELRQTAKAFNRLSSCFDISISGPLYRGVLVKKTIGLGNIRFKGLSSCSTDPRIATKFADSSGEALIGNVLTLDSSSINASSIAYTNVMISAIKREKAKIASLLASFMTQKGITLKKDIYNAKESLLQDTFIDSFEQGSGESEVTLFPGTYDVVNVYVME